MKSKAEEEVAPHCDAAQVGSGHFAATLARSAAAILLVSLLAGAADAAPPDVVVFLADDMGFSDLPSYGGEIETPTVEALARDGVRFSQFYVTPRCSPTRAALLTGRTPHAAGVGWLADSPTEHEAYRGAIRPDVATLPERLRDAGYRSYAVGKWHLDPALDAAGPDAPLARGFERYFGVLAGADDLYRPESLARDTERLSPPGAPFYLTDAISEEAARYVRDHARDTPERPFFLYVAFTAPHWPMQAPAADIDAQRGRFEGGWDAAREARAARLRELGALGAGWTLAPREVQVPPWTEAQDGDWERARMRAYAGMLRAMDRGIARVLEAVEESGRADQTLVVFLSDNGACAETLSRGARWLRQTAGYWTPAHFGDDRDIAPGGPESFQSYGPAWANLSNTPFRGYKAELREGGIASPLIVRWPAGLRRPPGTWVRELADVTDLAPTILELAGLDATPPLDGESLAPLLRGGTRTRRPIFWEHEGWAAVRDGDRKAVRPFLGDWELYDLANDRTELRDLAGERPDELARLVGLWEKWAEQVGVQPWPWVLPIATRAIVVCGLLVIALLVAGAWFALRLRRRARIVR